jgi:hypothetical protein
MKELAHIPYLVIALLLLVGCGERFATTDNPRSYNKAGMGIEYPRNWKVTEDTEQAGIRNLFVETPGNAIVIIQIYSAKDAFGIKAFAQNFARSAQEETAVGNVSVSRFSSVERSNGHETLTEPFSITVLGENVPHTRTYRRKTIDDKVCFIVAQVADEDRSKVTKGFEQIFSSFGYGTP